MVKKKTKRVKLSEPSGGTYAPNARPDPNTPTNPRTGEIPAAKTPFPAAFGAQASSPAGNAIGPKPEDITPFGSAPKPQVEAIGNSGTQIFGGYFSEEYLANLRGRTAARKWDEMRRSESQISMLMNSVKNPIKAANWDCQPYKNPDGSEQEKFDLQNEFIKYNLFECISAEKFKTEALTMVDFGFALFEMVDHVVLNHSRFGTFNGIKQLAFRSQKTIENWQLEAKTGRLLGVNQYTYSDLGGNNFIPGEFLLVFSLQQEGDNYEGISALRPMFGPYFRKNLYLQLAAIGVERYAVGVPVGTIPKGKEKSTEVGEFNKVLQNFTSHEASYITKPEGWTVEIVKGDFDASKIKELIVLENTEFANSIVANFLALGLHGSGSSLALGSNLLEFFTTGIQAYANTICDVINRVLIPRLIKMNFGEQPGYPTLKVTGISDKAGKELAETIKFLTDARALDPDKPLKEYLRKLYGMPKPDEDTAVVLPLAPAGGKSNIPNPGEPVLNPKTNKPEILQAHEPIQLAEKKAFSKRFDKNKAELKSFMQIGLRKLYAGLREQLRKKHGSLKGTDKILAAKSISTPGLIAYKAGLRDCLADYAAQSIREARKLVPKAKNVKLSEYDALPPHVRKLIDAQATLLGETQAADLEKIVTFQFTSGAMTEEDIDALLNQIDSKVFDTIDGSTGSGMSIDAAAGDVLAQITGQSAMAFFKDPEVEKSIESYTFTNEDPVSEICQAMDGVTVAVNDPILDQYMTPLHHNCKSRWVPNPKGAEDNPEIGSGDAQANGGLSLTKKALQSMTLAETKPRA